MKPLHLPWIHHYLKSTKSGMHISIYLFTIGNKLKRVYQLLESLVLFKLTVLFQTNQV